MPYSGMARFAAGSHGRPPSRIELRCWAGLAFVGEALDVFGAFLERTGGAALDELANLLDDVRISKRADVAGVHVIGNGGENAAHDLAGARLGHVRDDVDGFGAGNFADHGLD